MDELAARLRIDRRLARRRDFVAGEQLEKELRALPDVAAKAELVDSPQFPAQPPASAEAGNGGD